MLWHCGRSSDFTVHGHVKDTLEWARASDKTGAVLGGDEGQSWDWDGDEEAQSGKQMH